MAVTMDAYLVFIDQPNGQEIMPFAVQILSSVLDSPTAAVKAIEYVQTFTGPGFSAVLTRDQASQLQSQPGVLSVEKTKKFSLD
ncbi:OLC1v1015554C2 [Oldenlandia corymbosa var. corymbosa]|nr:OLC1v1015554C2 [Oldenlandia corymbosa var. corymbosa]